MLQPHTICSGIRRCRSRCSRRIRGVCATIAKRMGAWRSSVQRGGAPRIWIHASSVGARFEAVRPGSRTDCSSIIAAQVLAITTMTTTGRDAARRRIPDASAWMLAPFDSPRAVQIVSRALSSRCAADYRDRNLAQLFSRSGRDSAPRIAVVTAECPSEFDAPLYARAEPFRRRTWPRKSDHDAKPRRCVPLRQTRRTVRSRKQNYCHRKYQDSRQTRRTRCRFVPS